jgi:uncharacterized integral membrane protein
VEPRKESCSDKQGIECKDNEECTGNEVVASDSTACCLASCQQVEEEITCKDRGFTCKDTCSNSDNERTAYACEYGQICCNEGSSKMTWWPIILLIVLIILVVLAIIFRDKVRLLWFKLKSGVSFSKGPKPVSRSFPPPQQPVRPMSRPMPRPLPTPPPGAFRKPLPPRPGSRPQQKSDKDKEFEETMRKLREMSK